MLLKERLAEVREDPEKLVGLVNPIIVEGRESEYGELVALALDECEEALKSRMDQPLQNELLQHCAGRLAAVRDLRISLLEERVLPETEED